MRKNLYELLSERVFDVKAEYSTLWKLFCTEECYHLSYSSYSIAEWIDKTYFRNLPFRGTYTSLSELMHGIGLYERSDIDLDKLLLFCELICAMLPLLKSHDDGNVIRQVKVISENIDYILERTNHEVIKDSSKHYIIVEKNKSAALAAGLVGDETVAFELIEYNHFGLKGDLEGKKKLLVSIASYIEPILRDHTLQKKGYKQLESDAGFLFNNFHIRHNNRVGNTAKEYITSISNNELEEWYDKAYEVALSVIIINDYLSINQEISDVKTKYSWGN